MGEGLTPWMENALENLANNAKITTLPEQEKTTLLDFRESALFEEHDPEEHGNEDPGEKEAKMSTAMRCMILTHGFRWKMPIRG